MIYDRLANSQMYNGVHAGVARGLRFLRNTNFDLLLDGRYELDGDSVFADVVSGETAVHGGAPDCHDGFIHIQYLISGSERVLVSLAEEEDPCEDRPREAVCPGDGTGDVLTLGRERFLILWPGDANCSGLALDGIPTPVRRCVIQVKI